MQLEERLNWLLANHLALWQKRPLIFLRAVQKSCLIVGDRIESNIGFGRLQGMKTALVLICNASNVEADHLPQRIRPVSILGSIAQLRRYI